MLLTRAQHEEDRIRCYDRLAVDATSRASVFSLGEEEADIHKDNRMHGGKRAKSGGRSARASEFARA